MKFKLVYMVAEEVGIQSKGLSGTLELFDDRLEIAGPEPVSLRYSDIEDLTMSRLHRIGTFIHVRDASVSVFFTVPRINLFGILVIVNYFRTRKLFDQLTHRTNGRMSC